MKKNISCCSPVRTVRALATLVLALVVAGCGGGGETPVEARQAVQTIEPYAQGAQSEPSLMKRYAARSRATAAVVQLGALSASAQPQVPRKLAAQTPRQIGVGRQVAQTDSVAGTAQTLKWKPTASGGWVAAASFVSTDAVAVRVGLLVRRLPGVAVVRAYSQQADAALEVAGREVLAAIDRNTGAGDGSDAGRTYWMPSVKGQEATLEIELPAGLDPSMVEVAVPRISHLFASAQDAAEVQPKIGEAAYCEVDVSCNSSYSEESKSVAKMEFVDAGYTYLCTGTLMADKAASGTPYFLGANHCIDSQTIASSLITYWFYRSSSCNSRMLNSGYAVRYGGAALLYASASTDTSFMRLNATPPTGAVFAGSTAAPVSLGTALTGIHHPEGDLQKISTGAAQNYASCASLPCTTSQGGNFLGLLWNSGTTESGSSGSPVFSTVGGKRYVVGQLYAGSASCTNRGGLDYYGRFDVAYQARLSQWLGASPVDSSGVATARTPVYRFYNAGARAHFYTTDIAERDGVIAYNSQYRYEGTAFYAYARTQAGLDPVFRFYNAETRSHFYTISAAERDLVRANLPKFLYEGERWAARSTASADARPVYRFYQPAVGNHFYTISEEEKEFVRLNDKAYVYEGVGYHAWTQ